MNITMEEGLNWPLAIVLPLINRTTLTTATYFGVRAVKCPTDVWAYQEIIYAMKPDVIIEIGNAWGGGTLALAHLCDLLGHGKVIGIDIDHSMIHEKVRAHSRITLIEGDANLLVHEVEALVSPNERVLVIEDSAHTYENTLKVLRNYSKFTKVGDYFIVEDSACWHGINTGPKPGPYEAITTFLSENSNFKSDRSKEMFFITWNPMGFIKRIS